MTEYTAHFDDESFWKKVKSVALKAGYEVIRTALILYYCLCDPDTPAPAKAVIAGALGYFILPIDAIPDVTPVVGYSDDLMALMLAMAIVAAHIKPEHRSKAEEKLREWFNKD